MAQNIIKIKNLPDYEQITTYINGYYGNETHKNLITGFIHNKFGGVFMDGGISLLIGNFIDYESSTWSKEYKRDIILKIKDSDIEYQLDNAMATAEKWYNLLGACGILINNNKILPLSPLNFLETRGVKDEEMFFIMNGGKIRLYILDSINDNIKKYKMFVKEGKNYTSMLHEYKISETPYGNGFLENNGLYNLPIITRYKSKDKTIIYSGIYKLEYELSAVDAWGTYNGLKALTSQTVLTNVDLREDLAKAKDISENVGKTDYLTVLGANQELKNVSLGNITNYSELIVLIKDQIKRFCVSHGVPYDIVMGEVRDESGRAREQRLDNFNMVKENRFKPSRMFEKKVINKIIELEEFQGVIGKYVGITFFKDRPTLTVADEIKNNKNKIELNKIKLVQGIITIVEFYKETKNISPKEAKKYMDNNPEVIETLINDINKTKQLNTIEILQKESELELNKRDVKLKDLEIAKTKLQMGVITLVEYFMLLRGENEETVKLYIANNRDAIDIFITHNL